MAKSLLEKATEYEDKEEYFKALDCYLRIWSEKLYKKDTFEKATDEVRSVAYAGDKIVIGSRDEHLYLTGRDLKLLKKPVRVSGMVRSVKAVTVDGNHHILVVTRRKNRAIEGEPEDIFKDNPVFLCDSNLENPRTFSVPGDEEILAANFIQTDKGWQVIIGTNEGSIYL